MSDYRNISVYTDGGARGNPGVAGIGMVVLDDEGAAIYEAYEYIGETTNNQSEYRALISAAETVVEIDPDFVTFHADSELMVKQIKGEYRVKAADLKPIYAKAIGLLNKLKNWQIKHVRRNQNSRADELANVAMDTLGHEIVLDLTRSERKTSDKKSSELLKQSKSLFDGDDDKPLRCQLKMQNQCDCMTKNPGMDDLFEWVDLGSEGLCLILLEQILAYKNAGAALPGKVACPKCPSIAQID